MLSRAIAVLLLVLPSRVLAAPIEVCFTPGDDCTDAVVQEIDAAHRQVLVQAYSFTSEPIEEALVRAARRGVDVEVVLDKSQRTAQHTGAAVLADVGVPVLIDTIHGIAHNKVMVIDGGAVITGSFNFTKAAQEKNAENLLVIRDAAIAARYARNWRDRAAHAVPYRD